MKSKILLITFYLISVVSFAQTPYRNIEKYWWYRYRLVNDFMKIGDQCGESIPATERWRQYADEPNSPWDGLGWGDATQHLGNYINMLAGEHAMLRSNGMPTNRTNMELYYALNAFERLDKNAEEYCDDIDANYPCKATGTWKNINYKNGFFIRDDVPFWKSLPQYGYNDFVTTNFKHFNRPGILSTIPVNKVASAAFKDKVTLLNDPTAPLPAPPPSHPSGVKRMPVEESHNQIVQLYAGMAMATRLLDNSATYNGALLADKAARNLFNIINYIPTGDNIFSVSEWLIRNPTTANRVIGINSAFGSGGELFTFYSNGAVPGLMQTANSHSVSSNEIRDLNNITHTLGYAQMWQSAQFIGPGRIIGVNRAISDAVYANTYAAFANNWRAGIHIGPWTIGWNSTWDKIVTHARKEDFCMPHTPLMYRIVNGPGTGHGIGFDTKDQPTYETMINEAPFCGCHSYHPDDPARYPHNKVLNPSNIQEYGGWHWSSDNLFQDYDRRGGTGNDGDFNNLDYMTVFNLYNLNDKDYLKMYFNNYYLEDLRTHYTGQQPYIGSIDAMLTLNYLEYLSLRNRHESGSYVTYRGAKVVDLKPGFFADYGSSIFVYVEDYDCRKDDYHLATVRTRVHYHDRGVSNEPDTNYVEKPVEYAPDAVDYNVDQIAGNPDWVEPDTTFMPTQEDDQYYLDSLLADVRMSGDSVLISQLDSLMPHYDVPVAASGRGTASTIKRNGITGHSTLYPNPNTGRCTLILSKPSTGTIKVFNILGAQIYERSIHNEQRIFIDLGTQLPPGNYTIQIQTEQGREIKKLTIAY